jgi:hypothetical protein
MIKHPYLSAALGLLGLACVGLTALQPQKAAADPPGWFLHGATYLNTIKTSTGAFSSRSVVTFHADSTVSAIDSGQGGTTFLFSSQLGSWKPDGAGGIVARTLDFDFPSAGVARLDYTNVKFSADGTQVTGTITLTTFPLQSNPLDGGGTVEGSFTFTGSLVTP